MPYHIYTRQATASLLAAIELHAPAPVPAQNTPATRFPVNLAQQRGTMKPLWTIVWLQQAQIHQQERRPATILSELHALSPVTGYVRTHNLLANGNGSPTPMGFPQQPSLPRSSPYKKTGHLEQKNHPEKIAVKGRTLQTSIRLPRQGVPFS